MQSETFYRFESELLSPAHPEGKPGWTFVMLPAAISKQLPRRGRTTVEGALNGQEFRATLDPDGQLSHWLLVDSKLMEAAGVDAGDTVTVEIRPVEQEPEPEVPADFHEALKAAPKAKAVWDETTTIARLDWIHWIVSAKQAKTRAKRIMDACEQLAAGKRRVCCFDSSGFYSKALSAPEVVNRGSGSCE